jgi:L-arabinonolactonase
MSGASNLAPGGQWGIRTTLRSASACVSDPDMDPVAVIQAENMLGECILWDAQTESAWWTDIAGKALLKFDWRKRSLSRFPTPTRLGSFGFIEGQNFIIGAFEAGFALFDPETGMTSALLRPEGLTSTMRLNDGRVDPQGRFWAGAMVETPDRTHLAALYCLENGNIQAQEQGVAISNGICWSPDGTRFYFADSARQIIWRYAFDIVAGAISDREEFARTTGPACPDGATVDEEGYLWSAQWAGGCVVRYAPDGQIDRVIQMQVSQPTCVAFGGPNLDLLFVTTARAGLDQAMLLSQTGAGDVFVYNVGVRGLPENRFKLNGWPGLEIAGGLRSWHAPKARI